MVNATREAISTQPELQQLRSRLRQYIFSGMYEGGTRMPAPLPQSTSELDQTLAQLGIDDIISVVPGACLVSTPSWDPMSGFGALQVVRSCPKLYNKERFDFVSFERPQRQGRMYALTATSKKLVDGVDACVEQEFAFLQCYEKAAANVRDKLAAAGCKRIKPDHLHNKPWYEVLPLASLLSREFVTAVPNEDNVFHVSCFLPN